jgi:hypothetical protein
LLGANGLLLHPANPALMIIKPNVFTKVFIAVSQCV